MSGRNKFSNSLVQLPPDRLACFDALSEDLRAEMDLSRLRTARKLSQAAVGETLHVEQPAVAKIENWTDMYVSTLRRFIEAMGGKLKITAGFPDHDVRIKNYGDLAESEVP